MIRYMKYVETKIYVISLFIVKPLILEIKDDINGDKKIVATHDPPDTIPISVFDKPLYCKKTAIKPLIQQTVNQ